MGLEKIQGELNNFLKSSKQIRIETEKVQVRAEDIFGSSEGQMMLSVTNSVFETLLEEHRREKGSQLAPNDKVNILCQLLIVLEFAEHIDIKIKKKRYVQRKQARVKDDNSERTKK